MGVEIEEDDSAVAYRGNKRHLVQDWHVAHRTASTSLCYLLGAQRGCWAMSPCLYQLILRHRCDIIKQSSGVYKE